MKGKNTHLLFCTSGILLRRLLSDRNLNGVTHVFVDEIHERGMNEGAVLMILLYCFLAAVSILVLVLRYFYTYCCFLLPFFFLQIFS